MLEQWQAALVIQPASSACRGCEAEDYQVQSSAHGLRVIQNKDENHKPVEQPEQALNTRKLGRCHFYTGPDPGCHETWHCVTVCFWIPFSCIAQKGDLQQSLQNFDQLVFLSIVSELTLNFCAKTSSFHLCLYTKGTLIVPSTSTGRKG